MTATPRIITASLALLGGARCSLNTYGEADGTKESESSNTTTPTGTGIGTDTSLDTDTPTTGEPSQCTWKYLGDSGPSARAEHSMVYDSDRNQILLFGGIDGTERSDLWVFAHGKWTQPQPKSPPPPRKAHAAAYDPERKVMVVFGGLVGLPSDGVVLGDTQIYDPAEETWETPAPEPMPAPSPSLRCRHDVPRRQYPARGRKSDDAGQDRQ
jgi:hypothetical protein